MTEGLLVYRNGALVNLFAPIMVGSSKSKARSIHVFLQVSTPFDDLFGDLLTSINAISKYFDISQYLLG